MWRDHNSDAAEIIQGCWKTNPTIQKYLSNGWTLNYNYNIDSKQHEHLQVIRMLTQKGDLMYSGLWSRYVCKQSNISSWWIYNYQSNPNTYPNFQHLIIHICAIFPLMCDLPHFSLSNILTSLNFLYVPQ